MVLALGGLMIGVGLAFKLSAFPFHFWCPDVFEGATAEVNAFLSVASKAAALALSGARGRRLHDHSTRNDNGRRYPSGVAVGQRRCNRPIAGRITSAFPSSYAMRADTPRRRSRQDPLAPVRRFVALLIALFAAVTCTFGNLAAYGQTNIKRHDGLFHHRARRLHHDAGGGGGGAVGHESAAASEAAYAAVPFYIGLYLFMNLGAFAIIAFLRNALRSEEIDDYGGLVRVAPGVVICFATILFSLVGLPPLAGFAAKYVAFASLVQAMEAPQFRNVMLTLLVVGGLNTAAQPVLLSAGRENDDHRSGTGRSPGASVFRCFAAGAFRCRHHAAGAGFGHFLGSVLTPGSGAAQRIFCF